MNTTHVIMTPEEILTRWRLLRGWEPLCSGHISVTAHNSALDSLNMKGAQPLMDRFSFAMSRLKE